MAGRKQLRQAVAAWFAPPAVTGLERVEAAMPKILQGAELQAAATPGTGAACWVTLERDAQHRIAIGGAHSGQKLRVYRTHLQLIFKSLIAQTDQAGVDPGVLAMDAFDDILDGLQARLLADRTLGGTVWQAGEGAALFGEDVVIVTGTPQTTPDAIYIEGDLAFIAIEALVNT
jgi:hypothetical protein